MLREVLLAAGLLTATPTAVQYHGPNFDGMPPARYWGDFLLEHTLYTMEVAKYCGKAPDGFVVLACVTTADNGERYKIMPNPCFLGDVDFYARLECHENAHLRGWSSNHEM